MEQQHSAIRTHDRFEIVHVAELIHHLEIRNPLADLRPEFGDHDRLPPAAPSAPWPTTPPAKASKAEKVTARGNACFFIDIILARTCLPLIPAVESAIAEISGKFRLLRT